MKRREFITIFGGAAAWPLAARAQERVRRVGVLMNTLPDDSFGQQRVNALFQELQQIGLQADRNIRFDVRWAGGDAALYRKYAPELIALTPDILVGTGAPSVNALQQNTRSIPIVFVNAVDPVGAGLVASLAKPGGNTTGFTQFEFGISAKWIELLKEIAPRTKRAAVLRDPSTSGGIGLFAAIQSIAPSFGITVHPIDVRSADEIARGVISTAGMPDSGLVVLQNVNAIMYRDRIIKLATEHRLPAVYAYRVFASDGGLVSYGPDTVEPYRRAAHYVHRILNGEKAGDLPVQTPTKYELVINAKTARAIGLTVPPTLLARADEVIE